MTSRESPLVVLMSTSALTPRTNPYSTLLTSALEQIPGVRPEPFSWRTGLLGHFDVLHLHWPESRLRGSTRLRSILRQVLFVVVVVRAHICRRPIVRTVHNIELPTGLSRRERCILALVERWTRLRIRLNPETPVPPGRPVVTIPHGHYRDWFAAYPSPGPVPGRIAFFGLIRRYKAVPELARAFGETRGGADDLTLHISGHPSSPELAVSLEAAATADPRITLRLHRIDDGELVHEVGEAELVVLPYPEMHNSGAVLTALSLNRTVLAPQNTVNRALADEVGDGWLYLYQPPLTGTVLLDTLAQARRASRGAARLDARDWGLGAREHVAAYRSAIALTRRRP